VARRRIDPKLLIASFVIAAGIVLVITGLSVSVTGKKEQGLPPMIESVNPVKNATQVLSQASVFVDLVPGYDAVLVLDGVELPTVSLDDLSKNSALPQPGQQITLPKATIREPGNNTYTYTPVTGAPIEKFVTGVNTAQVIFWKITDGRTRAGSYTWSFTVV
jgi:hypothetical protein